MFCVWPFITTVVLWRNWHVRIPSAFTPVQGIILSYRHEEGNPFKLEIDNWKWTDTLNHNPFPLWYLLLLMANMFFWPLLVLLAVFVKHFSKELKAVGVVDSSFRWYYPCRVLIVRPLLYRTEFKKIKIWWLFQALVDWFFSFVALVFEEQALVICTQLPLGARLARYYKNIFDELGTNMLWVMHH